MDAELGIPAPISIRRFGRLNPARTASTMRRHARPRHIGQRQNCTREACPERGTPQARINPTRSGAILLGIQHYSLERWQSG